MDIYSRRSKYNRQLHTLYYFQKAKKSDFSGFSRYPEFLHVNTEDYPYNQHDRLRPFEHIHIRKILNFFYPVTEIHFECLIKTVIKKNNKKNYIWASREFARHRGKFYAKK